MRRTNLPIVAPLVWLCLIGRFDLASTAAAQEVKGVLRAIDAREGTVIVKKITGELTELRVAPGAKITLDGSPTALDALKPGLRVLGLSQAGSSTVVTLRCETEPVTLSVTISREGECRINFGRGIATDPPRLEGELVPITTWYFSRPAEERGGAKGSLIIVPDEPKKRGGMAVSPRSFRLPCSLTLEIADLGDAHLEVEWFTSRAYYGLFITSDDQLRDSAKLRVTCKSGAPDQTGLFPQALLSIEQSFRLARPRELRFYLPFPREELDGLFTVNALLRLPLAAKLVGRPTVRDFRLQARDQRTLGLALVAKQGKVAVYSLDSKGLAARAGVEVGDVIVSMKDYKLPIANTLDLAEFGFNLGLTPDAKLTLLRGGKQRLVTIPLEEPTSR